MNEKLDLTEILKGFEGMTFYHTTYGNVVLKEIKKSISYNPIIFTTTNMFGDKFEGSVSKEGFNDDEYDGECVFFPSKDQRDWSKFEETIIIDTPMMCYDEKNDKWSLYYYAGFGGGERCLRKSKDGEAFPMSWMKYVIPYDKFDPSNKEESLKHNIQK